MAKITGFDGEFVMLSTPNGPLNTSCKSFLNKEWTTFKAKDAVEFFNGLQKLSFMKSDKGPKHERMDNHRGNDISGKG